MSAEVFSWLLHECRRPDFAQTTGRTHITPFKRPPAPGSPRRGHSDPEEDGVADMRPFRSHYRYLPTEVQVLRGAYARARRPVRFPRILNEAASLAALRARYEEIQEQLTGRPPTTKPRTPRWAMRKVGPGQGTVKVNDGRERSEDRQGRVRQQVRYAAIAAPSPPPVHRFREVMPQPLVRPRLPSISLGDWDAAAARVAGVTPVHRVTAAVFGAETATAWLARPAAADADLTAGPLRLALLPPSKGPLTLQRLTEIADTLLAEGPLLPGHHEPPHCFLQALRAAKVLAGLELAASTARCPTLPQGPRALLLVDVWSADLLWEGAPALLASTVPFVHALVLAQTQAHSGELCAVRGTQWLLAFPSPSAAVHCSTDLQVGLLQEPWVPELAEWPVSAPVHAADGATMLFAGLRVRCALHWGTLAGPAGEFDGSVVVATLHNVLARAQGGHILATADLNAACDDEEEGYFRLLAPAYYDAVDGKEVYSMVPPGLEGRTEWLAAQHLPQSPTAGDDRSESPRLLTPEPVDPAVAMARLREFISDLECAASSPRLQPGGCLATVHAAGASAVWETDPHAACGAVALHHACAHRLMQDFDGQLFRAEVDRLLFAFPTAQAAVQFGVALQEALLEVDWPAGVLNHPAGQEVMDGAEAGAGSGSGTGRLFRGLRACVALHTADGRPMRDLLKQGRGGQIILSPEVYALVGPTAGAVVSLVRPDGPYRAYPSSLIGRLTILHTEEEALEGSSREPAPSGLVALVYAHIDGWREFEAQDPDVAAAAWDVCRSVYTTALAQGDGYEAAVRGGTVLLAFPTALMAVAWCLRVQKALLRADWPEGVGALFGSVAVESRATTLDTDQEAEEYVDEDATSEREDPTSASASLSADNDRLWRGLRVGMGVHLGAPLSTEDPQDGRTRYAGPAVRDATRLGRRVAGGHIVATVETLHAAQRDMNWDSLGPGVWLRPLGSVADLSGTTLLYHLLPRCLERRASSGPPWVSQHDAPDDDIGSEGPGEWWADEPVRDAFEDRHSFISIRNGVRGPLHGPDQEARVGDIRALLTDMKAALDREEDSVLCEQLRDMIFALQRQFVELVLGSSPSGPPSPGGTHTPSSASQSVLMDDSPVAMPMRHAIALVASDAEEWMHSPRAEFVGRRASRAMSEVFENLSPDVAPAWLRRRAIKALLVDLLADERSEREATQLEEEYISRDLHATWSEKGRSLLAWGWQCAREVHSETVARRLILEWEETEWHQYVQSWRELRERVALSTADPFSPLVAEAAGRLVVEAAERTAVGALLRTWAAVRRACERWQLRANGPWLHPFQVRLHLLRSQEHPSSHHRCPFVSPKDCPFPRCKAAHAVPSLDAGPSHFWA